MVKNKGVLGLALALFFLPLSACFFNSQQNSNQPVTESTPTIDKPDVDLAKPLEISQRPEDLELCKKINSTIDGSEFANARWGVIAISLKDGRVACARDGQKLFNPASIHKLLTSVVALDKLGPNFRWRTKVMTGKEIVNGEIEGDLVLHGEGAPDFDSAALEKLVSDLQAKGLRRIKGNVIGDESFFKGDSIGDGWAWGEIQWYYGAEASALTFNENQAEITLSGGRPKANTDFVETSGEIKPGGDPEAVGLKRGLGDNKVYAWGNGQNLEAKIAVTNPALWAAKSLKTELEKRGIKVDGEARSVDWKSGVKPESGIELAKVESATLAEMIRKMNKDSVNLYAELILRTLGKKFGEEAPDENPKFQKLRGDDSAGATYIEKWLRENKIASGDFQVHDGSGLSRLDMISPEIIGRALIFAAQSKFANEFKDSLPVAGQSGTLKGRLQNVSGRVLGKTGSMTYVNSLAGYANSSKGETFAFAIICNNETRKADSNALIDSITTTLIN